MGDVRLLLPCGEASSQDAQRRLTRTAGFSGLDIGEAEELAAEGFEDRQPSMAVLVLGGFSAATTPPHSHRSGGTLQRGPSTMRSINEAELGAATCKRMSQTDRTARMGLQVMHDAWHGRCVCHAGAAWELCEALENVLA